jgi:ribosomal protein S18 acetylase RimI-like enzyme
MKTLERIAEINAECFTSDDDYSDADYLADLIEADCGYHVVKSDGEIVGYILFRAHNTHLETLRLAVTKDYQRMGYGTRLNKALIRTARKMGKPIKTYISKSNVISINAHIKVGYRIDLIDKDWVYIYHKGI